MFSNPISVRILAIGLLLMTACGVLAQSQVVGPEEDVLLPHKQKLDKTIKVEFLDIPLRRAVEVLQRELGTTILLGETVADLKINLQSAAMPVRQVLDIVSQSHDLDWDIDKGVILLDSYHKIQVRHTETRVYDIKALLFRAPKFFGPIFDIDRSLGNTPRGGSGGRLGAARDVDSTGGIAFDLSAATSLFGSPAEPAGDESLISREERVTALTEMIQDTVGRPEEWTERGGDLSSLREVSGSLVVKTSRRKHRELENLLTQLEQSMRAMIGVEARALSVRSAEVDKFLADNKGSLILDAKATDKLLADLAQNTTGVKQLHITRSICHNGQRIYVSVGRNQTYLSHLEPIPGTAGASPTLSTARQGMVIDFEPTISVDRKATLLVFRSDLTSDTELRQTSIPVGSSGSGARMVVSGPLVGKTESTAPVTQPAHGSISGNLSLKGSIQPEQPAVAGAATLEMPQEDSLRFRSAVRIPHGGAVLLSGTSKAMKGTESDREIILLIRTRLVE